MVNIDGLAMQYDYAGQRTHKGEKTYYNQGNTILGENWLEGSTEKFIYYYYDESGVCGFSYNNIDYHYEKNILGDIIAIYDVFGNKICYYKYDAWGNHRVFDGSTNLDITNNTGAPVLIGGVYVNTHTHIGNVNSFRYRSYYYDTEIGMYYLQSRYYDPQIGRFINADDVEYLEPYIINGSNLYAYSLNNPVMYYDPDGYSFLLVGTGLGLLIKAAIALIAVGSIVIIESQFHPIENTVRLIAQGIEKLGEQVWTSLKGTNNKIDSWLSSNYNKKLLLNDRESIWDSVFFIERGRIEQGNIKSS